MGFIADALWHIKLGEYKTAAKVLGEHLQDAGLKSSSKVSIMEWIAECYCKCEESMEAAKWFESAGRTALDCNDFPTIERKRKALKEFERALDCYKAENNMDGIRRMATLKYSVSPSLR